MKTIRLLGMMSFALMLAGFALIQPVKADVDCRQQCTADADQFYEDCMNLNKVGQDVCSAQSNTAEELCDEDCPPLDN
jgi:hypothetical protein